MKACTKCGAEKSLTEFYRDGHRLKSACKKCEHAHQRNRYLNEPRFKQERASHCREYISEPENSRAKQDIARNRKYRLTPEGFAAMLEAQGGLCKVCRTDKPGGSFGRTFMVDHDHQTGEVRGLLCHHCNSALGYAKDDAARLRELANYLDEHHAATCSETRLTTTHRKD